MRRDIAGTLVLDAGVLIELLLQSLADCFILALAKKLGCKALFAKREVELEEELKKKSFDVEIVFIEE